MGTKSLPENDGVGQGAIRAALLVVGAAVLMLFAVFVWPTKYRYDHMHVTTGDTSAVMPVRIDRFTGRAEELVPAISKSGGGWTTLGDSAGKKR